jgi:hypothetical protein
MIDSTKEQLVRGKASSTFRYLVCAAIGVTFGMLCYWLFQKNEPNED